MTDTLNITKMMGTARLLAMSFSMGIGNLRQISVKTETTADPNQIRNQKKLIDSPELDEIRSQDAKMRRYAEINACKFTGQEGVLIIADAVIPVVDRVLVAYETIRRPALVAGFMLKYRAEFETDFALTRAALGDVFDKRDYPHPDVVEAGFTFNYHYMDIKTDGTITIADPNIREREEKKATAIIIKAAEDMRAMMRTAGAQLVEAMFDALKPEVGKKKKLSCHLENLQQFLSTYNVKDVTDDFEYRRHIEIIQQIMGGVSIEKLRESDNLKVNLAEKLDTVRKELRTMVITSGRKFRS